MLIKERQEATKTNNKPIKKKRNMNPLKTLCGVVIIFLFWYLAVGQVILPPKWPFNTQETKMKSYEMPCTEGYAVKVLDLTLLGHEIKDVEGQLWYEKYYKALDEELGIKSLDVANALDTISYGEVATLLDEAFGEKYTVALEGQDAEKEISVNEFMSLYQSALSQVGKNVQLEERELVILAVPGDGVGLEAWQLASAGGIYQFEGLILDPLKGKTVKALVKGNEILSIIGIVSDKSVIKLCTIEGVTDETVTIEANNLHLSYKNHGISEEVVGQSGALTLEGDKAISFESTKKQEIGIANTSNEKQEEEVDLRVLLSDGGEYNQISVNLLSEQDYNVVYNGETKVLKAGETWDSETFNWVEGVDTVYIKPQSETSEIQVLTITKASGHPAYKGVLEVRKEDDHYILINEIAMEDYVAAVIPSEMPTSYGLEALKVQAIAARTYAYASIGSQKFADYGAQIDDTTSSQVYNNIFPDEMAYEAAEATRGQILQDSEENPISSKFFATSCGYTANCGEVWAGDSFPNYTPDYLVAEKQYEGQDVVASMENEEEAKKFFKLGAEDLVAYDEASPWFRWQVKLTRLELTALMQPAIARLTSRSSDLVKVLTDTGTWEKQTVEDIGIIQELKVMGRGEGGNILSLQVKGENATVKVSTEYYIRSLFASNDQQDLIVTKQNGSTSSAMSLLPSAFFAIEEGEDGTFTLYGGGFGHGVGMSQDGARGMAKMGKDYERIIAHYYPTLEIAQVY